MPAPGRLGRIPRDTTRFAPTLEHYLRKHPVTAKTGLEQVADSEDVDRASKVTEWPIYRNDTIGDCTCAAMAHAFTAMSVYAGKGQVLFSDDAVIQMYSAVSGYDPATGANDNGAQMQDVLRYCRDVGLPDTSGKVHKVISYAAFGNPSDITLLARALKTFGCCYLGGDIAQAQEDQFDAGQPWQYEPGSPILGGHAFGLHRREPYGSRVGVWDVSTWGAVQHATIPFLAHQLTEAWIFCTEDWIEASGASVDGIMLAQLEADMRLVLGRRVRGLVSGQASKFLVAVLGALGEAARTGHFDWRSLVAGMIAAVAVYLVPNSAGGQVPPVQPPKEPQNM